MEQVWDKNKEKGLFSSSCACVVVFYAVNRTQRKPKHKENESVFLPVYCPVLISKTKKARLCFSLMEGGDDEARSQTAVMIPA